MKALAASIALLFVVGCGASAEGVARSTLATTAHAVQAVDQANANAMSQTRERHLEESQSADEFEGKRMAFYRVEEVVRGARQLLFATERGIDASGADALEAAAPCIVAALARLRAFARDASDIPGIFIELPASVDGVLAFLEPFAGQCEAGEVTQ